MTEIDGFDKSKDFAKDILQIFVLLTIAAISLFYDDWYAAKVNARFIEAAIFLVLFGLVHWRFCRSLAYFYNVQRMTNPLARAITVKPVFLQLLGIGTLIAGLVVFVCCY